MFGLMCCLSSHCVPWAVFVVEQISLLQCELRTFSFLIFGLCSVSAENDCIYVNMSVQVKFL
jgi:hypothetical protein